jgi:diacylglycerol kinase family enzyme
MRRAFLVLRNPNAGRGARQRNDAVLGALRAAGAVVEVVETTRRGEGLRLAAEAADSGRFDAIIAAGGDGAVHDAACGLLGRATPLGVLPMGTANVFAREIGMPRAPQRLADLLLHGAARPIPMGRIDGRPFLFCVGVGFDAAAVRRFEAAGARRFGGAGMVWAVARTLLSDRGDGLVATTDHGSAPAEWIIVTRARRYAGGLTLAPAARVTEPSLHVARFGGRGAFVRLRQLLLLRCGLARHDPDIAVEAATFVRIEGAAATPIDADGELFDDALPIEIDLHPERVRVIMPGA